MLVHYPANHVTFLLGEMFQIENLIYNVMCGELADGKTDKRTEHVLSMSSLLVLNIDWLPKDAVNCHQILFFRVLVSVSSIHTRVNYCLLPSI